MPKLNGKHYAYTKEGYSAYKRAKAKKKRSRNKKNYTVRQGFNTYDEALKDREQYPKVRTVYLRKKTFKSRNIKL